MRQIQAPRRIALDIVLLAIIGVTPLAIACSRADMLVGEWQCDTPEPIHLSFTKDGVQEDFYNSLSYTENRQTYTVQWQVAHEGTILFTAAPPHIPGLGWRPEARPRKIVGLTRNKFVVEWKGGTPYEFRSVR